MKKCMKKIIAGLLAALLIFLGLNGYSYAAGNIAENANVKVFVSGQQVNFSSAPITVNGQILLNGKELLVKLGIPNDNKHIQLDKNQKNLIINTGKKQIKMTVNSTKATVGKSSSVLNAAPVFYKNIYYIPAKSAAQLLDMKYAWDEDEKSVYIQKLNDYNKVKAVLDKAVAASGAANKYIVEYSMESVLDDREYPVTDKVSATGKVDKKKKIMYASGDIDDFSGGNAGTVIYLYDNSAYTRNAGEEYWKKNLFTKQEYQEHLSFFDISKFKVSEALYCGLTFQENQNNKAILLKGNVYLHEVEEDIGLLDPEDTYLEISINKSNYLINSIERSFNKYVYIEDIADFHYSVRETLIYKNYNGDFTVEIPDESKMEFEDDDDSQNSGATITLDKSEQSRINNLSAKAEKIPVDGAWENPYNLDSTEAIMFVIIKNKSDFDTFTGLSEGAKKVFINQIVQDNYGDYIGCQTVYGKVVYNGKAYAGITTGYGKEPESVTLEKYSFGTSVTVVIQDKRNNTYTEYK